MAGAFPISSANFDTLGIKSIQKTLISESASGKKLVRQIDGQKFGFTANIIIAKRSDVYGELRRKGTQYKIIVVCEKNKPGGAALHEGWYDRFPSLQHRRGPRSPSDIALSY